MAIHLRPHLLLRALQVLAFGGLVGAGVSLAGTLPPESETPPEIRKGISEALARKLREVGEMKNDKGEPYKRGNFSKSFHRVDDSTYKVGFHIDTAMPDNLVTERYVMTLKQGPGGEWSTTDEALEDTYKGLYRAVLGDEKCFRFDSFSFDREGFKVTATNGTVCQDYLLGRVWRIAFASDDLACDYLPPMAQDQSLWEVLKKDKPKDTLFDPGHALVECDPTSCEGLAAGFKGLEEIQRDQIDPRLKNAWDKALQELAKNLRDNPFHGFQRPYEDDHRTYSLRVEQEGVGDAAVGLVVDNYQGNEVSFVVQGLGSTLLGFEFTTPLFTYHSEVSRNSGLSPEDLERRPDPNTRSYDLQSVRGTLEMGFGDGETLVGDLTYGLTTKEALREIPFYIARLSNIGQPQSERSPRMDINSLQDGDGNEMTWVRVGPLEGLVVLPAEVPAGTHMTMRLQFVNKDLLYKVTPAFTNVDRGGWLPFNQFADFIHEFDLTIKVPARYKTLGIGQKVSEEIKDGASITRWVANKPISFPAVIFGQYHEARSSIKAQKLDGTEIPVVMHVDKDSMADWELRPKALEKLADDAANSLNLYAQIFQVDYPYDKLDLVNDPAGIFYAQAPSSLIYVGSPVFIAKGTLASADGAGGGAGIAQFVDSVIPHEVAHQWWGSLITMANFRNYWFVESLAEYSSALFMENAYGKEQYYKHINIWRDEILENDMRSSVQNGYTEWQGPGGFGPFRAALYSKGPYAFHIMRSTWGDEAFFKFLKTLVEDLSGKEIVTRDIQRVAEKSFGANLDWFFDQWLRGVGLPEYTFTYDVRETEEGKFLIEGEVVQRILLKAAMDNNKEVLDGQYFTGLVPITVIGKSGKEYRKKLILEGPKTTFKFTIPEKPKDVIFNKYGESLSYDTVVSASR